MKPYNILVKKDSSKKIDEILVVEDGFSFSAFLFGVFWFLYHKMFKEVLILVLAVFFIQQLAGISTENDNLLLKISFAVIIAFNANFWLLQNLKRNKNYEFLGIIYCKNINNARLSIFNSFDKNVFSKNFLDPKFNNSFLDKIISFFDRTK